MAEFGPELARDPADVLVVGAGPSGSTAARTLAESGFGVTVLEQGGWVNRVDYPSAKVYAAEAGVEVTYDAMRIDGGYGYINEFPIERYVRDARLMPIGEGTDEMLRMIVAKELLA